MAKISLVDIETGEIYADEMTQSDAIDYVLNNRLNYVGQSEDAGYYYVEENLW